MLNKIGPRIEPCCTPHEIFFTRLLSSTCDLISGPELDLRMAVQHHTHEI